MIIQNLNSEEEVANQTEVIFKKLYQEKKRILRGFFPTGRSAEGFYQKLRNDLPFWQKKFQVIQIDEFIGSERLFYSSLRHLVLEPLSLLSQVEAIDPLWNDAQIKTHIQKTLSEPIDFALLGLGPNGHVGFHEPHITDSPFYGGRVLLSDESFKRVANAPSQTALTFGAASFLKAEKIILIATGKGKEDIYSQFLSSAPTPEIPATLLKTHPDLTVLTTLGSK